MSFVAAAAVVGGSALSAGGSIFGGLMGNSAQKKLAAAMQQAGEQGAKNILQASKDASAQAGQMHTTAMGYLSPFQGYGVQAGDLLTKLLMGGPNAENLIQASPMFQFQSDQGMQNLNRQLAARGLYGSGAGLQTLANFNNQLVADEGNNIMSQLSSLVGMGANAGSNMASLTNQTGINQGQFLYNGGVDAANMRYNSLIGAAQARAQGQQMIGQMGQDVMGTFGNALASWPMMSSSIGLNNAMAKKLSLNSESQSSESNPFTSLLGIG